METVAAEVGIGGSAVYRHFKGKQDLLTQVMLGGLAEFEDAANAADASVLDALAAVAVRRRAVPVLWQREARHLDRATRSEVQLRTEALRGRVEQALRAVAPNQATSRIRAQAVLSVLWSPAHHQASLPQDESERLLAGLAYAAWSADLPPSAPPTAAVGMTAESEIRAEAAPRPVRAAQRERILEVSSALFAERGFAAVGVDDVGAVLGVSGASIYRYYPTKACLLHTALVRAADALDLSPFRALSSADGPWHVLDAVLASYVDVMLEHPAITQLLITEVTYLPESEKLAIRRKQQDYVGEWLRLLPEVHPGMTVNAARVVTHAALAVVNDLLRGSQRGGDREALREYAIAFGRAVLHAT